MLNVEIEHKIAKNSKFESLQFLTTLEESLSRSIHLILGSESGVHFQRCRLKLYSNTGV